MLASLRATDLLQALAREIHRVCPPRPLRFMEVCGGHTAAIHRYALSTLLPQNVELLSGPGCPVCVTTDQYIDECVALSERQDTMVMSFGDLLRVPGTRGSLAEARARGGNVRVVYSPVEAVNYARENPQQTVVLLAIGFETTACTIAAAAGLAMDEHLQNFKLHSALKTMPAALRTLLCDPQVKIDGLILPGHVLTVTGVAPFEFLPAEFGIPCAVAGFEPADLLTSILQLCQQGAERKSRLEIQYSRAVRFAGNPAAQTAINRVFESCPSEWRGLGSIPDSGLKLREEFLKWDARAIVPQVPISKATNGCCCGEILRGILQPQECPLFGRACSPEKPRGACMVSSEGACAAAYQYGAPINV